MNKLNFIKGVNVVTYLPEMESFIHSLSYKKIIFLNDLHPTQVKPFVDKLLKEEDDILVFSNQYLVIFYMSLLVEYRKNKQPMKFFSVLSKNEIYEGNDLVEVLKNPVLDAFVAHHDLEHRFFNEKLNKVKNGTH